MTVRKMLSYLTVFVATLGLLVAVPGCPKSKESSETAAKKQPAKQKSQKQKGDTSKAKTKKSRRVIEDE